MTSASTAGSLEPMKINYLRTRCSRRSFIMSDRCSVTNVRRQGVSANSIIRPKRQASPFTVFKRVHFFLHDICRLTDASCEQFRMLAEGTAAAVRAFNENKLFANPVQPTKLYYVGPMFRYFNSELIELAETPCLRTFVTEHRSDIIKLRRLHRDFRAYGIVRKRRR
jgi:hypothetical protein